MKIELSTLTASLRTENDKSSQQSISWQTAADSPGQSGLTSNMVSFLSVTVTGLVSPRLEELPISNKKLSIDRI